MTESLLQTKLNIPPLLSNLVPRPRLIDRLNQGLQLGRRVTLVSAPAGFGKTTIVSEWVAGLNAAGGKVNQVNTRIAWLSLDENDGELTRFLDYFIAAINCAVPLESAVGQGSLNMLRSPQAPPIQEILTPLINEISDQSGRVVLVLDDYHIVDSSSVDDALTFVLDNLPRQMHVVIATREDPRLALARMRAKGQLTELRALDLRFSKSEAAEFLNQSMGLDLTQQDVAALEARTEGWIAGLQLAAISMQGRADTSSFIGSFAGTHRYVLDYLIEEVLGRQPEAIQSFLLQTATLDRLTGLLCDAVTEKEGGQIILERLEQANLFIVSLDEERRWYRYHHLFSDLLRRRLRQQQPDLLPVLNRRASQWYAQNGFVEEAIDHAIRAGEYDRATNLIESVADSLWQRGRHAKLLRWLDALPESVVVARPLLCVFQAWDHVIGGRQEAAERSLEAAEKSLADGSEPASGSALEELSEMDAAKIQGRITTVRAFLAFFRGDMQGIYAFAHQALEHLPETDEAWRSAASVALGDAYTFVGDAESANRHRSEAMRASWASGNDYMTLLAGMKLAVTMRQQGKLNQAADLCSQLSTLAQESGLSRAALFGWLLSIWGEILAEVNELDEAKLTTERGAELIRHGRDLAMVGWSSLCQIRVLYSTGDQAGADAIVREMEQAALNKNIPPWITSLMAAWRVRIWLAQDNVQAASQWVRERGLDVDGEPSLMDEIEYLALARVLIAEEKLEESLDLLERLLLSGKGDSRVARTFEIFILQAIALQAKGALDEAMLKMERILIIAEQSGFVRTLLDEGRPVKRLLYEASARGIMPETSRRFLSIMQSDKPIPSNEVAVITDQSHLIEPLSERELEVLQLICMGLTNNEIASNLYLSLNTVKVHTRNIYSKLDVHNRAQAIARSQELDLLPRT